MPTTVRSINNFQDVQAALKDIWDQLNVLQNAPLNLNGRIITGVPDPKIDSDAVNLSYLKAKIKELKG